MVWCTDIFGIRESVKNLRNEIASQLNGRWVDCVIIFCVYNSGLTDQLNNASRSVGCFEWRLHHRSLKDNNGSTLYLLSVMRRPSDDPRFQLRWLSGKSCIITLISRSVVKAICPSCQCMCHRNCMLTDKQQVKQNYSNIRLLLLRMSYKCCIILYIQLTRVIRNVHISQHLSFFRPDKIWWLHSWIIQSAIVKV